MAAKISGSVSGTWDNHTEYTKNAVDSEHSAKVEAAKKGIVYCSKHVGTWTSRPKTGMISSKTEVRDCPNCQEEHGLESKKRQMESDHEAKKRHMEMENESRKLQMEHAQSAPVPTANPVYASPMHGTQHYHSNAPVAYGVMAATPGMLPIDRNKGYSSEWYEVTNDIPVCCCTFCVCCVPFAICDIGQRVRSTSHGVPGVILALVATVCYPCGIVCCTKQMMPCFITDLIKKSMAVHGIGKAPGPCGDSEACCGCWWQAMFCTPCTLAVLYREAKTKPIKG